jgi:hypothetical protein
MNFKSAISAATVVLVALLCAPAARAEAGDSASSGASTGSFAIYDVTSGTWFDPAIGGGINVGDTVRTFYQGVLGGITPASLGVSESSGKSQITVTASFDQRIESVTGSGRGITNYIAESLGGGSVNIYLDRNPATFADIAKGTGFTDGILLASGTLRSGTLTLLDNARRDRATGNSTFVADLNWNVSGTRGGHERNDRIPFYNGFADSIAITTALNFGCDQCDAAQTASFFGTTVPRSGVLRASGSAVLVPAQAIPEPGTFSLILGGLALLGGLVARQRPR